MDCSLNCPSRCLKIIDTLRNEIGIADDGSHYGYALLLTP
jgi:hypothetical protein